VRDDDPGHRELVDALADQLLRPVVERTRGLVEQQQPGPGDEGASDHHPPVREDGCLEFIGMFANAMVGAAVARHYRLDPLGFAILAVLTALGGGMFRDTLLQKGPPVALVHWAHVTTALADAAVAYLVLVEERRLWLRVHPCVDGLAMGCFASVGAHKALLLDVGWLPAILLGAVSAVGGGVLRDVAVGRMPLIFGGNPVRELRSSRQRRHGGDGSERLQPDGTTGRVIPGCTAVAGGQDAAMGTADQPVLARRDAGSPSSAAGG